MHEAVIKKKRTGGQEMYPYGRGPIYEPKDSRYRPNSISTLLSFLIFRCIGRMFRSIWNGLRRRPKQ